MSITLYYYTTITNDGFSLEKIFFLHRNSGLLHYFIYDFYYIIDYDEIIYFVACSTYHQPTSETQSTVPTSE